MTFGIRIFTQVELGQSYQSLAILGKQEIIILPFVAAIEVMVRAS